MSTRQVLLGQTVVVIGGSAGIGLETARRARAAGADIILAARSLGPLERGGQELGALKIAAFDANDAEALGAFFQSLPGQVDHVMVTAGAPHYAPPFSMSQDEARRGLTDHLLCALEVGR